MKRIINTVFCILIFCSISVFAQINTGKEQIPPQVKSGPVQKVTTGPQILITAVYYWNWDFGTANWNTIDSAREINFEYDGMYNNIVFKTCNDTNLNDSGKYVKTYNANKSIASTTYQTKKVSDITWINQTKDTTTYDASNKLTSYLYQIYNGVGWEGYYKFSYQYDVNNKLLTDLYQTHSGTGLVPDSLNTFSYDANNNLIGYVSQSWSGSNWLNRIKDTITYNANNSITSQRFQTMQGFNWVDSLLILKTYDVNNNLTSYLSQKWNGSSWVNLELYNYTYDAYNNKTLEVYQKWNFTSWLNINKYSYTYDANKNMTGKLFQTWKTSSWVNANQYITTYDLANNELTDLYEVWNGITWIKSKFQEWMYDANHLMLSSTSRHFNSTGTIVSYGDSIYYYYHSVSGINNLDNQTINILVYPNPAKGEFEFLTENGLFAGKSIEVYNVIGEKIFSQTLMNKNKFLINLTSQPNGVYFYKLVSENGSIMQNGRLLITK